MLRVAYTVEQCWHPVPGGTARAALEVLERLDQRHDVDVVAVAGRHRRPPTPSYRPPVGVEHLAVGRPLLYETWNHVERPRVESATGPVDVCHSTAAIPAATNAAHVVTVHDIAFVDMPERFTRRGVRVMTRGLERCRRADLVLCPSRTTAEALERLRFDPRRLRVVPWGVSAERVGQADRRRVGERYGLPAEFVLFVGTLEPRKNLAGLARAIDRVDLPLVVAGPTGWGDLPPPEHAQVLGFVPSQDLPALYSLATVVAYPSLSEGFGMPVAEAMAHGTPVVTSRGTATEEVAGGAAVLVDPLDDASIAAGLVEAATDASIWARRGLDRAAELSWDHTTDATVAAYREVAG